MSVITPEECRSCQAPILMVAHERTERRAPIDRDPSPRGNCIVDLEAATYRVLAGDDLKAARAQGAVLRTSHFTACPRAANHRRGK